MKRPSSDGSVSRMRSPRGVVRTDFVKGLGRLCWVMAEADAFTDFIVVVKRSM